MRISMHRADKESMGKGCSTNNQEHFAASAIFFDNLHNPLHHFPGVVKSCYLFT
jgi:hypothetical protein